jgi:hypothetical protein
MPGLRQTTRPPEKIMPAQGSDSTAQHERTLPNDMEPTTVLGAAVEVNDGFSAIG